MQRYSAATKNFTRSLLKSSPKPSFSLSNSSHFTNRRSSKTNSSVTTYDGQLLRCMSSNSKSNESGGGTRAAAFGSVVVLSLFGGALGYAGIDPEFRNYVEGLIPGAKDVFQAVLGSTGINEGYVHE